MNTTQPIPPTRNEGWGFFGTMKQYAAAAWPIAIQSIAEATGERPDAVRAFLDAAPGRHFADEVLDWLDDNDSLAAAIEAVTRRWMNWTIGARTSRDYGIPRGLPYLTGFVIHCDHT
ncbi:hypothetical protein, partial [Burkholderia territorii]